LRQGRIREGALKASLDERDQKLTQLEGELVRHTAVDPETGLHTQQYFQEFLEREWRRASRERQPLAVLMIELDHFRAFHERQGQSEADASLKRIARQRFQTPRTPPERCYFGGTAVPESSVSYWAGPTPKAPWCSPERLPHRCRSDERTEPRFNLPA
jgi:PleD family two-component response regulator